MKPIFFIIIFFSVLGLPAQNLQFTYDVSGNLKEKVVEGRSFDMEIEGPTELCEGDTLNWVAKGEGVFRWSGGQSGAELQIVPEKGGTYAVTVTKADGCEASLTQAFQIYPRPVLQGIQQIESAENRTIASYVTTSIPMVEYFWEVTNGTLIKGQGTPAIEVQWSTGRDQGMVSVYAISEYGCWSKPLVISGGGLAEQRIALSEGWNLVSTYTDPVENTSEAVFRQLIERDKLELVKNIDQLYSPGIPVGNTLSRLLPGAGYWVKVNDNDVWEVKGFKLNPENTPISLKEGWNLIGFLPYQAMNVKKALASVLPDLKFVKNAFASFDPTAPDLLNTLTEMKPGEGYWLDMEKEATLLFPEDASTSGLWMAQKADQSRAKALRNLIKVYPNSTAAYGEVTRDGKPVGSGKLILAKVGQEVRGGGYTQILNGRSMVTLIINGTEKEKVHFYLDDSQEILMSDFVLQASPGTNLQSELPITFGHKLVTFKTEVFPNPSSGILGINLLVDQARLVDLTVFDLNGRVIANLVRDQLFESGSHQLSYDLQARGLESGLYVLEVRSGSEISRHKLIVIQNP